MPGAGRLTHASSRVDGVGADAIDAPFLVLADASTLRRLKTPQIRCFKRTNYTGKSGCGVVRYQGRCSVTPLGNASVAATLVSRGAT